MACPVTVNETVCLQAEVKIRPAVDVGEIMTFCAGSPFIGSCDGEHVEYCSFMVGQRICVQVPLDFHAEAEATPAGIVCGRPGIGGCPSGQACVHPLSYWQQNPDEVSSLIADVGGSIILGSGALGLSYTVTAANAGAVLNLNTPLPPVPDPPLNTDYQQLYAQLLAARLNQINGATCLYADAKTAEADLFLVTSKPEGKAGAGIIADELATFNAGAASGCPGACP